MSRQTPPLPAKWVDRIFAKLTLTDGRQFTDQYRNLDTDAVKTNWALELAGFD